MASNLPRSQIAGVQSVIPVAVAVTGDRKVRPISAADPSGDGILQRTLNIVLYYKQDNGGGHDSGWLVAGWIKESLGRALVEQLLLSGRLRRRRRTTAEENCGGLEVVANDSGARLVEAKIPVSLPEFLELVKRDDRAEDEVVFWKDIDEDDPQFSPLFYVQVTNFQCGGYSIGISCSILVADIVIGTDFLREWSEIHSSIVPKPKDDEPSKTPIFYLPKLKQDIGYLSVMNRSISIQNRDKPMIFHAKPANPNTDSCRKIASDCVKKAAEIKHGGRMGSVVSLFVKEHDDVKLEVVCSRHEVLNLENNNDSVETQIVGLEDLGLSEIGFWQGSRSDHSSCWVGSVSDGLVFVFPCKGKTTARAIVAIP